MENSVEKLLEAVTTAPGAAAAERGDTIFGFTVAGLMVMLVLSLVGLAYVVYAKKQSKLIIGICGVALMIVPYFISNSLVMAAAGVVLIFLPFVLSRVGIDL